ncbi:ABC transporter ATP-binding protein [Acetobacteraceae bacterium KSS12]|uniref:ABC transporter ATP-binding protein n=2 Tax=Rhizosaccharibacter radicis TaxID=2782605 RepID=A0ABT1VUY3_9PROT|nr:ABC transporter ATP-binding protein [Acetobacteraceae bacterium KSS12]
MRGITKSFYGTLANDGVDFDLRAGEIHALLGENGAGKSTLMNVLTGLYQPDAGEILIENHPRRLDNPAAAIEAGIGMVHQHFKLVQNFTVAENIHLGWEETPRRAGAAALEARTQALSERFGLPVTPGARVADIPVGEQQRVEILRVLARGARVLVLDEPTAVLTPSEVAALFTALRGFRADGNAVILISHKLGEVLEIADHVTVMRGGRSVAQCPAAGASRASLARLIIGDLPPSGRAVAAPLPDVEPVEPRADPDPLPARDVADPAASRRPSAPPGIAATAGAGPSVPHPAPTMVLREVSVRDARGVTLLDRVSIEIMPGELLGIAGVAGNGQRPLAEVMTGLLAPSEGELLLDGASMRGIGPRGFASRGVGHMPEDRLRTGLAATLPQGENALLREYHLPPSTRFGWLFDPAGARRLARGIINAAAVNRRDPSIPARNLSGGNQQRLVAERETRISHRLLVAAYPTRGLDVGAVAALHAAMHRLRARGVAVVLISEEIEELLDHADRIAVLCAGRISGILPVAEADPEKLGLLMSGQSLASGAPVSA